MKKHVKFNAINFNNLVSREKTKNKNEIPITGNIKIRLIPLSFLALQDIYSTVTYYDTLLPI